MRNSVFVLMFLLSLFSCKKEFEGEYNSGNYPETFMVVDSIFRNGEIRYTTTVEAHWWGTIESGYIKGFEVSTDNMATWTFTAKQNGTFVLTLPIGSDTANIPLFVRAVSDKGLTDPTPASLIYPIRNSMPSINFIGDDTNRTSSFPALWLSWIIKDDDGPADIDYIELALNDTVSNKITLPSSVVNTTLVGEKNGLNFTGDFIVYNNPQKILFGQKLSGILYNDSNTILIRAVDKSGGKSDWDVLRLYIRKPGNGLLFISDYTGSSRTRALNFYKSRIQNLGSAYSAYDIVQSSARELPTDNFALTKTFEYFNRIVWITNNYIQSLRTAQLTTSSFFTNGGKMFLALEFISSERSNDDPAFSFTPIKELVNSGDRLLKMKMGDKIIPYDLSWPSLKASEAIDYAIPFFTHTTSSGLYAYDSLATAQLTSTGLGNSFPWTGQSNVLSKRINTQSGKTDMVVLTVPMYLMNGDNNADDFFQKIVLNELQF